MSVIFAKKTVCHVFLFVFIFILILNPYTVLGKPASVVAFFLSVYAIMSGSAGFFIRYYMFPVLLMLFIAVWGTMISNFNGIGQYNHVIAVISFALMIFSSQGVWFLCRKLDITFDDLVLLVSLVAILNSLIIICEVAYPLFRQLLETFLVPAGNIDWRYGFRFRGLAASGGAGLSVLTPVCSMCLFYLYGRGRVSLVFLIGSLLVILFATINIGRTGLVLFPISVCYYFLYLTKKRLSFFRITLALVILILSMVFLSYLYSYLLVYFSGKFGDGFTYYAFGFLSDGMAGVESEGTLTAIIQFIEVLPLSFPEALIGVGFYGGSDFFPWTDSGYSRMFLSVGFPLGFVFYFCVFLVYFRSISSSRVLFFGILTILTVAEVKEPFLFSNISARLMVLMLVFSKMDASIDCRYGRLN
jgi:hypothetical protein